MALSSLSSCPVCNEKQFNPFLTCTDYTASHENFTLKRCGHCQFVFTDPRPDDSTLPRYYLSDNYISHTGGTNSIIDKLYLLVRKRALIWKKALVETNAKPGRLLDIGCGTGDFLAQMKSHNWSTTGVEPSAIARETAEKKTGTKIYQDISDVNEKTFSAITLWHVLEHLPDPNQALQAMQNLLAESGTIFIAVPNLHSYDAQHYNSYWAAYDVPRHLWHFSKDTMKMLLEKNGFRLTKIIPMKMDSFYVSLLSESYQHPAKSKPLQLIHAFIAGLRSNLAATKSREHSSHIYVVKR